MQKIVIIFLITVLCSNSLISQNSETISLSVSEAQEYAIINNKQLRNVRADTDIARHRFWESVSQGLPQVSASFDYIDYFNYEMEFGMMGGDDNGGMMDISPEDIAKLDEGDWVIINMLQSAFGGGPSVIKMHNQATANLQVSQLLFSGQYIAGIQISRIAKMLADKNVNKSEIDIKEAVTSSYYMVLITEESIRLVEENLKNLQETKKQTRALVNAGMLEPIDVDQIKMSITMLENNVRSMKRNLELSYNILRIQLGLDNAVNIVLTESLSSLIEEVDVNQLITKNFIPEQNIDYKMIGTQKEIAEKMIDMERWAYAPTIVGAYVYNEKIRTTDFDMTPNHLLTLRVDIPIFSSGQRKSRVEQKRIELYQVSNTQELLRDQLLMQEQQMRYNLIDAQEQYDSHKKNVALAKRIYNHTEKKFRHGVATSLDLTQANSNYLQAETNYISSALDLLQAQLNFKKLLNSL